MGMMAEAASIWAFALAATGLVSVLAWRRTAAGERLAMQFGPDGMPTWTAPRLVALCFTPILGCLMAAAFLALGAFGPMVGVAGAYRVGNAAAAAALVLAHVLHLRMAVRRGRP